MAFISSDGGNENLIHKSKIGQVHALRLSFLPRVLIASGYKQSIGALSVFLELWSGLYFYKLISKRFLFVYFSK